MALAPTGRHSALYQGQLQMARNLELAYLIALEDPSIALEIRSMSRDALDVQQATYTMMQTLESTVSHVVETMLPILRNGIQMKDLDLIRKACGRTESYCKEMLCETKKAQTRHQKFKDDTQERVETLKLSELTEDDRSAEKEREIKGATKELREKQNQLKRQITTKKIAETTDFGPPTFLEGNFCAAVLLSALNFCPPAGIVLAVGYVGLRSTAAMIHAFVSDDNPCTSRKELQEDLENLNKQIENVSIKAAQRGDKTFEAQQEIQKCLQNALVYAKLLDQSTKSMIDFWTKMEMKLTRITNDTSANDAYLSDLEKYADFLTKATYKDEEHWKEVGAMCADYSELYEQNTMYSFLSVNHADKERAALEARKVYLTDMINEQR